MAYASKTVQWRRVVKPVFLLFALFYLTFHAVSGERGVIAYARETRALDKANAELADLRDRRESLERKAKLLNASSLDLDMLDEQARKQLGYASAQDIIIYDAK